MWAVQQIALIASVFWSYAAKVGSEQGIIIIIIITIMIINAFICWLFHNAKSQQTSMKNINLKQ